MTDKEVIVTNEGSSTGALVAGIVAVLLIALAVWYFGFNPQNAGDTDTTVDVPVATTAP